MGDVSVLRDVLRWLMVPVSAAAVIVVAIAAARWAVSIADRRCPAHSMIGGACTEPWHTTVVEGAIYIAVAAVAVGLVILPALIAPKLKRTVSAIAFLLVAALSASTYLLMGWGDTLTQFVITLACGAVATWWVWSWRHSQ